MDESLVTSGKFDDNSPVNVKKKQAATNHTLNKLHELISDPVTNDNESWISRLLYNFLRDDGDDGYKIQDLPIVMQILEFLIQRARDVDEYKIHLEKMLELCKLPPLLQKIGDSLGCKVILERYFTMLGHLIAVSPTDTDISKIFQAISCLLVRSDQEAKPSAVKADLCLLAMERSGLPIISAQLLETSSCIMYRRVLELVFLLAENSYICCYRFLEAGILDNLLIRMDDEIFFHEETVLWKECTVIATNIAWALMRSIIYPNKFPPELQNLPEPNTEATRSLRNVLRRQIRESNMGGSQDIMFRNDLAVLILAGLVAFPSWQLVKSGLAEDLIVLSIATESKANGTWVEDVKFRANNEDDLFFKKIMLSILSQLCNQCGGAIIAIMMEQRVMARILELINPTNADSCYISEFPMRILAQLVPKMPEEFILQKGAFRLVAMLTEWSNWSVKFDSQIVMELTKTICNIITVKCCPIVLKSFHEAGIVPSVVELVNRILAFDRLTMQHQRILTVLIVTVEEIAKATVRCPVEKSRANLSVKILTKLLDRCFYRRKNDFQMDQRLLIAIGSCIWECVVSRPENTEEFVKNGGIFMVLDVIDNAIFPVRCIYLGILTDMCSAGYGVLSQLCTWRGADKTKGFMSLLAKSWREEEIRTGVKRTPEGLIEDMELPIMGMEQWIDAFHARATYDSSPCFASILGSMRPKIYAVRKIIKHKSDRYEISKEHYKIFLHDTQSEERVTMYIVDQFYRFSQGQLWSEVSRYLEQRGVNLLGMDGEIMILMIDRLCGWATYVRGLQDSLLRDERKKETEREQNEIIRIRDSKLGSSLKALEKMHYLRRTTDRSYMIETKKAQCAQIKDSFTFSGHSDREHFHSCFDDKLNVTTIFEENRTIPSAHTHPVNTEASELLPVSRVVSFSLDTVGSSSPKTSTECLFRL